MANIVHINSKQAMLAFARKNIAGLIQMLSEVGMSYTEIEDGLRLVKRNGMTAWELVNKPRKKKVKPGNLKARVAAAQAAATTTKLP